MNEELICTPEELRAEADEAKNSILPDKSKLRYEQCYNAFSKWNIVMKVHVITENVLLAYFKNMAEKNAPPTLWTIYSMLRTMINIKHGVNITDFHNVTAFIKNKNKGYVPCKAPVFSEEQILSFMTNAPNNMFLATKVRL